MAGEMKKERAGFISLVHDLGQWAATRRGMRVVKALQIEIEACKDGRIHVSKCLTLDGREWFGQFADSARGNAICVSGAGIIIHSSARWVHQKPCMAIKSTVAQHVFVRVRFTTKFCLIWANVHAELT